MKTLKRLSIALVLLFSLFAVFTVSTAYADEVKDSTPHAYWGVWQTTDNGKILYLSPTQDVSTPNQDDGILYGYDSSAVTPWGKIGELNNIIAVVIVKTGNERLNIINGSHLFADLKNCKVIKDMENIDFSNARRLDYMFDSFASNTDKSEVEFEEINTSEKLTNTEGMFKSVNTHFIVPTHMNTENVTEMGKMFQDSTAEVLDIESFNNRSAVNINKMFYGCKYVTRILVNHNLWINKTYTYKENTFYGCDKLIGDSDDGYSCVYIDDPHPDGDYAHVCMKESFGKYTGYLTNCC